MTNCRLKGASAPMRFPFSLWYGWQTLALLIQLTNTMYFQWDAEFFHSHPWYTLVLSSVACIGGFWALVGGIGFPSAIAWGLFGVYNQHYDDSIDTTALTGFIVLIIFIGVSLIISRLRALNAEQDEEDTQRANSEGETIPLVLSQNWVKQPEVPTLPTAPQMYVFPHPPPMPASLYPQFYPTQNQVYVPYQFYPYPDPSYAQPPQEEPLNNSTTAPQ